MLSEVSEAVGGAAVIRAYGLEDRARRRLRDRIRSLYQAAHARRRCTSPPCSRSATSSGRSRSPRSPSSPAFERPELGLDVSEVVAFLFLMNLILSPIGELSEILDQTQTAIAGWRKVLAVLDVPIDVVEPTDADPAAAGPAGGASDATSSSPTATAAACCTASTSSSRPARTSPSSARPVRARRRSPSCCAGSPTPPSGASSSAVSTSATSLRRAAPAHPHGAAGRLPLRHDDPRERAARPRRRDRRRRRDGVRDARARLVARAPARRPRHRGRRAGREPSVGERQLVVARRARSSATPGCSCSTRRRARSTPRPSGRSPARCCAPARGRTTISVAHRLSTAEPPTWCSCSTPACSSSRGSHTELVAAAASTPALYASWLGNTTERRNPT